jgi:hypothetical protein
MLRYLLLLANPAQLFPVNPGKAEQTSRSVIVLGTRAADNPASGLAGQPMPVRTYAAVQDDGRTDGIQFMSKPTGAVPHLYCDHFSHAS